MKRIKIAAMVLAVLFPLGLLADEKPKRITVATWNVEWFFDDDAGDASSDLAKQQSAPSRDEWNWKLAGVAKIIADMQPDILALQEVENRAVLRHLTRHLADVHSQHYRIAYIEGWDTFTEQDVAVIYRSGLVQYSCREQSAAMFKSREFHNLTKHLFAEFQWGTGDDLESLTLLNLHLLASPEKHDLREKQCRLARYWLRDAIQRDDNLIILGDINTEESTRSIAKGSDMAILTGIELAPELPTLHDLNEHLKPADRATHLGGKQLDRIIASGSLLNNAKRRTDLVFSRIDNYRSRVVVGTPDDNHFDDFYGIARRLRDFSDHYPIMAEFIFR